MTTQPWQAAHYADWSRGRLDLTAAEAIARERWEGSVFRVIREDARLGSQVGGIDVVRQYRVMLHSVTGPKFWICETSDGTVTVGSAHSYEIVKKNRGQVTS